MGKPKMGGKWGRGQNGEAKNGEKMGNGTKWGSQNSLSKNNVFENETMI
jgi:hypothetical protein